MTVEQILATAPATIKKLPLAQQQRWAEQQLAIRSSVTPAMVIAERERRLALGFDYTFQDARGVHRIATSEADMRGWREVTDAANAAINAGAPNTEITIATETGVCAVTAMEWQSILLAAAVFRQPIWASSFVLQAMDPTPADYADNKYWP